MVFGKCYMRLIFTEFWVILLSTAVVVSPYESVVADYLEVIRG